MSTKEIVKKQRDFFHTNATKNIKYRKQRLLHLKKTIEKYETEILEALKLDLGKTYAESYMCEIGMVISELNYTLKHLDAWTKPKRVHTPISQFLAKSKIFYEPYGVTLIIAPWNYPFMLAIDPIIAAVASGNTFILKPSEYSENTTGILKKLISEVFSEEYGAVVCGGVEETTELLSNRFDFIFFTGSTSVGKVVAKAAAESLTPVCLELGGKSPCIVDKTANLELSAKRIVWGKLLNAGQTCVAPDYVCVHSDVADRFIQLVEKYIEKLYGAKSQTFKNLPSIITSRHLERAVRLLDCGNIIYGGGYDKEKLRIEPTIVLNPPPNSDIMQEEIFAPILPILTYKDADKLINQLKSKEKPLALYLFTNDNNLKSKVLNSLSFGGGCVNDTIVHLATPQLPFGGVGNSGQGNYHGRNGFMTFSHEKSVLYRSNLIDINLRYPPFNNKKIKIFKSIMK